MQIRFNDCIKCPGADDLVVLWTDIDGKKFAMAFGVVGPMTRNLWGQRARGPGIHDVRIADEAVGFASCRLIEARRRLGKRIHWKLAQLRYDGFIGRGLPARGRSIPDREGYAEKALPADRPILIQPIDPVFIARPHEWRVPLDTSTLLEQSFFLVQKPNKPLAGRDEFERPLAFLVKLNGMLDAARLFDQGRAEPRKRVAAFRAYKISDRLPCLLDVFSLQR